MPITRRLKQARDVVTLLWEQPGQTRNLLRLAKVAGRPPIVARHPWLAFDVVRFLETAVSPSAKVFEYGGGGSTAWFADRVGEVVCVEGDDDWAQSLAETFRGETHVIILAIDQYANPDGYVMAINDFPDDSFDFVIIDGRHRLRCMAAAIRKIRLGGSIILDDTDRDRYSTAADLVPGWRMRQFRGLAPGKSSPGYTTIWTRT